MKLIMINLCIATLLVLQGSLAETYIVDPGPVVIATKGEIWPKPNDQVYSDGFLIIRPGVFEFQAGNFTCDILTEAFDRYLRIMATLNTNERKKFVKSSERTYRSNPRFVDEMDHLLVNLKAPCERLPYLGMDESYEINFVDAPYRIEAFSIWGILRGLESFSQLLLLENTKGDLRVNVTRIVDAPRFSHRGLLVDTSRHYVSMFNLRRILDGMAYNKLNVFHWHIVDDHSFPYQSKVYPELSEQGAFHPQLVYTQEDVENVIEAARVRGIRVMAEFDTPGHTRSWGVSHPEILTECHGPYEGKLGPLDPTKDETYTFINRLFKEVVEVFPEKYIHLGGDEVGFECWQSNADIGRFMKLNNISTYEKLEDYYIQKLIDTVDSYNANSMVWQEVFVNGVRLPMNTVVHVWTGNARLLMKRITGQGLPALTSACWYLDHLKTGGDWQKYYNCDPHDFDGTDAQKKLVMGGEACMWGEVVDNANILQRIFPRVSAVAEKLWSSEDVKDASEAAHRLEEHACRMNIRGIPAQPPNGPGVCL